jgi:hypothetical protein
MKDINLPKPDKYETMQLVAFLQQLITYNGFYDESLGKIVPLLIPNASRIRAFRAYSNCMLNES